MDELDGDPEPRLTAEEIQQHFSLLPALCDLLAALENQQDRSEIVRVASKLSDKIAGAFALLEAMPGADCTVQEQHLLLEQKQATLEKKTYV